MAFLTSDWFTWVVVIILIGSFISIFEGSFKNDVGETFKNFILFIPMLIAGIALYVFKDFKNFKTGYIVIFIVISIIIFGFYMGYKAGPYNPPSE